MLAGRKIGVIVALMVFGVSGFLSGCGEDDGLGETVYLHVINAYPGSNQLTLYGPTGKVASGLGFGERTAEPVSVNRNVNSDEFMLMLDGAPTAIELNKQLFSMYPQETGTLVVSRRAGEEVADMSLFRHTRTFSPSCSMVLGNSLSLNNDYLADSLSSYSFQTEWQMVEQDYYVESVEAAAETRCGPTPIRSGDRQRRSEDVFDKIPEDPWFFPVVGDEPGTYSLIWGVREKDPRTGEMLSVGLGAGGQVAAYNNSFQFKDCMSAAVSIRPEDEESDGEDEACPVPTGENGMYAEDQVLWDDVAAIECHEPQYFTGFPTEPGQPDSATLFTMRAREEGGDVVCGYPIRIRTPIQDLIFQTIDDKVPNYIDGLGGFVQFNDEFPIGETRFFVLYGRPVNPFVAKWNSGEYSAKDTDGGEFPYPGGLVPGYSAP